ncbi:hypothetical protein [Winogradskyella endarachnes]|uniref:Uncharacterized protein n=1 Tax=Winogradskyella endarachnes TaxID=2681965 RepID=A0A6L6U484_9FLAO|nr:hypothetical protein [Winogradskyella endarachnes]MUU76841.1 hypothetical protein [Winogradskyella endarachnes]
MLVNKIYKITLFLLGLVYILLQGFGMELQGAVIATVTLVLLTLFYSKSTKYISKFFLSFLVIFTLAESINAVYWFLPAVDDNKIDYLYYISNILFIISYLVLIYKMIRQLNLKVVFSELTIPIIVLIALDIFCVSLISSTTVETLTYQQYLLEYIYNAVVMALLSFALIDYMYRNNSKSMLFLLGCIFMTFSEIIQLAYFYILTDDNLGFVYSFFLVVAFFFFYMQSQYKVTEPELAYEDEAFKIEKT